MLCFFFLRPWLIRIKIYEGKGRLLFHDSIVTHLLVRVSLNELFFCSIIIIFCSIYIHRKVSYKKNACFTNNNNNKDEIVKIENVCFLLTCRLYIKVNEHWEVKIEKSKTKSEWWLIKTDLFRGEEHHPLNDLLFPHRMKRFSLNDFDVLHYRDRR